MASYYPSPDFSGANGAFTGNLTVGGNTAITGTLDVTGATDFDGAVDVDGAFSVADTKFTVAAASGNTAVAGTLGVTGASTLAGVSATTIAGSGDFAIATNKFTVASASGNTVVAGTLNSTGVITGPAGAAATPGIKVGASQTGIYEVAGPSLGLVASGGVFATIDGTATVFLNNLVRTSNGFAMSGISSPAQITSNKTDYDPFGTLPYLYNVLRLSTDATRTINSLLAGVSGQCVQLFNIGAQSIVLLHDDSATGTAAYRFLCPNSASVTILKNESVMLWYDITSARWRVAMSLQIGAS